MRQCTRKKGAHKGRPYSPITHFQSTLTSHMSTTLQEPSPVQHALDELQQLIDEGLPALTREYAPPGLLDTWHAMHAEVQRLREAFTTPALAGKTVVALGGGFSAGKSSLVNALLGARLMPTDVVPTTAVPAYAMRGAAARIQALAPDGTLREVSAAQLKNFTHSASDAAAVPNLRALYAQQPDFIWSNLALLDTPGYSSPGGADAHMARTWLGSAHAIIWCVPADAGTIPASDLEFLATLDKKIPLAIAITKTDKKPAEDIDSIAALVEKTLREHSFAPQHIWRISARQPQALQELKAWLEKHDSKTPRSLSSTTLALVLHIQAQMYEYMEKTTSLDECNLPRAVLAPGRSTSAGGGIRVFFNEKTGKFEDSPPPSSPSPSPAKPAPETADIMRRLKNQTDLFTLLFPPIFERLAQAVDAEQGSDSSDTQAAKAFMDANPKERATILKFMQFAGKENHVLKTTQENMLFIRRLEEVQKSYAAVCKNHRSRQPVWGINRFIFGTKIQLDATELQRSMQEAAKEEGISAVANAWACVAI